MARYSLRDAARLRDAEAELGCIREAGPKALAWLAPILAELTGAEKALLASYAPRGDGVRVEQGAVAGMSLDIVGAIDRFIDGQAVGWTAYNALCPEPSQRNRTLTMRQLLALIGDFSPPLLRRSTPASDFMSATKLRCSCARGPRRSGTWGCFRQESSTAASSVCSRA